MTRDILQCKGFEMAKSTVVHIVYGSCAVLIIKKCPAWNFPNTTDVLINSTKKKSTVAHRHLNLSLVQVPHVKGSALKFKHVLDYPGYKAQGSSPFSQRYSTMLTWRLIFRQVEKFLHLNTRLIFTRLQLIGNQHWKVGYKPQDLGSRLLHRAARRTLEKEGCISSCGKPGSSTLPTNMTNVVIVKEGWLHKRGTNSSTRSFLKNSSQTPLSRTSGVADK